MNALTLVQTSPATNPDRNFVDVSPSGAYVQGTADPLPLNQIADPQQVNQVPIGNPGGSPDLPVTPGIFNNWTPGYYPQVQRTVANGITSFGLRWFVEATGLELASGAFPAAIVNGETFLEILCHVVQQ